MTALPVNVRFVLVINCAVCGRIVWAFVTCGNGYAGRCVLVGWAWKMLCKLRVGAGSGDGAEVSDWLVDVIFGEF